VKFHYLIAYAYVVSMLETMVTKYYRSAFYCKCHCNKMYHFYKEGCQNAEKKGGQVVLARKGWIPTLAHKSRAATKKSTWQMSTSFCDKSDHIEEAIF